MTPMLMTSLANRFIDDKKEDDPIVMRMIDYDDIDASHLSPTLPVPHHSPPHPRPGPGNPASPVGDEPSFKMTY